MVSTGGTDRIKTNLIRCGKKKFLAMAIMVMGEFAIGGSNGSRLAGVPLDWRK
jgi:hypothetical protein